jgi:hypothetical protein
VSTIENNKIKRLEVLGNKFPCFQPILEDHLSNFKIMEEDICGITPFWGDTSFEGGVKKFSECVESLLIQKEPRNVLISKIYVYMEELIKNGKDVQNAVGDLFFGSPH